MLKVKTVKSYFQLQKARLVYGIISSISFINSSSLSKTMRTKQINLVIDEDFLY